MKMPDMAIMSLYVITKHHMTGWRASSSWNVVWKLHGQLQWQALRADADDERENCRPDQAEHSAVTRLGSLW